MCAGLRRLSQQPPWEPQLEVCLALKAGSDAEAGIKFLDVAFCAFLASKDAYSCLMRPWPCLNAVNSFPSSMRPEGRLTFIGLTCTPLTCTSKCRCGPVALPDMPT